MLKSTINKYKEHYISLIKIGFPIVLGQLGIIILGFADTLMIGHHSTNELAAASFVNNIFNLIILFGTGFAYGLTPLIGESYGKKDYINIGKLLKNSLFSNLIIAVLLSAIMCVLYIRIEYLGQPKELMIYIKPYFLIVLSSILFVMLFNGFKQFAEGITDTKTPMWILIFGNIFNIIGNYILIYGKLGIPELGIIGAGLSTLISRILMLFAFIIIFLKENKYKEYKMGFRKSAITKETFKKMNLMGWPIALQMGMESASFNLSAIMIGWIGSIALAAHQIAGTISTLSFMVLYGMGAAISIRISYFKGQNDIIKIKETAISGFHLNITICIFAALIYFLIKNHIGYLFTDNQDVAAITSSLIIILMLYQIGDGTQITFANALRGISDVKSMMYIAFIAYFIVSLPIGYILGFILNWGIYGVWLAYPIGLSVAGILFAFRFNRKIKQLVNI